MSPPSTCWMPVASLSAEYVLPEPEGPYSPTKSAFGSALLVDGAKTRGLSCAFISACHNERSVPLELAAELTFKPLVLFEARIFRHDRIARICGPVPGLDAGPPDVRADLDLFPAHGEPVLIHVHGDERVRLVGFLCYKAEEAAAGSSSIEGVKTPLDERSLYMPARRLSSQPQDMGRDRHAGRFVVVDGAQVGVQPVDQRAKPDAVLFPGDHDLGIAVRECILVTVLRDLGLSGAHHLAGL